MSNKSLPSVRVADLIQKSPELTDLIRMGIDSGAYSQSEVAVRVGVHKSTISRWVKKGGSHEDQKVSAPERE